LLTFLKKMRGKESWCGLDRQSAEQEP